MPSCGQPSRLTTGLGRPCGSPTCPQAPPRKIIFGGRAWPSARSRTSRTRASAEAGYVTTGSGALQSPATTTRPRRSSPYPLAYPPAPRVGAGGGENPFTKRELTGALSNPPTPVFLERLNSRHASLQEGSQAAAVLRPPRRKPQPVLKTIRRIPQEAGRPMHAREIHAAAEQLLGASVSWPSVKHCLSTHSRGEGPRFRRLRRGWYRLSSPAGRT